MTDRNAPTDDELAQRVRRSMSHYRMDGPMPAPRSRSRRWWQIGQLAAAAGAGAAATLVGLALIDGIAAEPTGVPGTSASPSVVGSISPHSTVPSATAPSPSAADLRTPEEAAAECLDPVPQPMPSDWLESGDEPADIAARMADLPLVLREDRGHMSVFVFADDRFFVSCQWSHDAPSPSGVTQGSHTDVERPDLAVLTASREVPVDGSHDPHLDQVAVGVVDEEAATVRVGLEDGDRIDARVADGFWLAWWEGEVDPISVESSDRGGERLAADVWPGSVDTELVGTTWTVMAVLEGHGVDSAVPPAATVRLDPDGTVAFDTGCNTGGGTYRFVGDSIVFADVVTTDVLCTGEALRLEEALLTVLSAEAATYVVVGETLTLGAERIGIELCAC